MASCRRQLSPDGMQLELKVLRGKSAVADAKSPLIGFANPVFDRTPEQLHQNVRVAANVTASRVLRGAVADIDELRGG